MDQFRRFVIRTAEIFVVVLVVLMTLSFAMSSYAFGGGSILGFLIGGALGFVVSSLVAASFFLLAEIADNTRTSQQDRGYGRE